ncbi:MAG TPA: transposase [Spirochaetia bacterium]|nr:transposase [Spirochaetia bacterium]
MIKLDLNRLRSELDGLGKGQRGAVLQRHADIYGVSRATIYRMLRMEFGKSKTVKRDKKIDQSLIDAVAQIKIGGMNLGAISTNKRNPREVPTDIAIDLLEKKYGVCDADSLTVSTVNRRLRESGFRQSQPRVRVECEYANQEHQLDFSRSKYFQITDFDAEANDWILKVSGRELHYKQGDQNFRLWICALKDSYSRVRLARAYGATGESAALGLGFLNYCYTRQEDDHPLNHIPDTLKCDQGAFSKMAEVRNAMKALNIIIQRSATYNKESNAKIESNFVTVWRRFELGKAIELGVGATLYLAQYNRMLHEFCIADLEKQHPYRRANTRGMDYRISIANHPPREISEDIFQYALRTFERTVPATRDVSINNIILECPQYTIDRRIRIYRNLNGEYIGEMIDESRQSFQLKPYKTFKPDEYEHRPHAGYRQEMELGAKRLEKERLATKDRSEAWKNYKQQIHETIEQEAVSPFNRDGTEQFKNEREARRYIGQRLPSGLNYTDVESVFEIIFQKEIYDKAMIDSMIAEIPIYIHVE